MLSVRPTGTSRKSRFSLSSARRAAAFLLLACVGCKGETTAPPVPTTLAANSPTSVTGVAGAVLTPPPSVIVKDQNGSPISGEPVTFAVVSGGGSVSGATVTTGASGVAAVGSWTLGTATGENVLSASSGALNGVVFTAIATSGPAASLAKNAGDNQTAVAGSTVSIPPSVLVKDANGNPKGGVSVSFAVASGGGSVTGATAVTNAAGVAAVGSWTLGPVTGENSLSATSAGLPGVVFTALSASGAAASLVKNAGDNQTASAGSAVLTPPSVLVKDASGNPKPGVSVTFAVVSGGGSITGAAAATNAAGVAAVGSWTLGNASGMNSLSATVSGLPPVTFTAHAISLACTVTSAHPLGTTTSGTLSPTDCQLSDGTYVDFLATTVPQTGAYFFRQSAAFDTYLMLALPDGTRVAEYDDDELEPGSTDSRIKALLPAGDYLLVPGSHNPAVTGDYTISSMAASADVSNCELVFIVGNITTAQNLTATDCNLAGPGATPVYSDYFYIFLGAGTSVTINMTSPALDSFLQLRRLDGLVVAQNDNADATTKNARITFTAPATEGDYYAIFARSVPTTDVGAYTLSIHSASLAASQRQQPRQVVDPAMKMMLRSRPKGPRQ